MITQLNNNIVECWQSNAEKNPDGEAIVCMSMTEPPFRWTFSELFATAGAFRRHLAEQGVRRNDVCALILRHDPYFYPLYIAVVQMGAIPAVLAYPNPRLHPEKFRQGIMGMSQRSGLDWLLTERALEEELDICVKKGRSTIRGIFFPLEWGIKKHKRSGTSSPGLLASGFRGSDPLLLQHSSGTTGLQKPVLLSHRAVVNNLVHYAKAIRLTKDDKVVSWLPLYHDMGLIAAFHLPLAFGIPSIQLDPFEWICSPLLLLEAISREKGSICWLPNFAYSIMADKIREEDMQGISLESWRMAINCSEPIRDHSHEKFVKRFSPFGFRETALASSYAMAETTFAVTQSRPGKAPAKIFVDRREFSRGVIKIAENDSGAKVCVSSGAAIEGCSIKIVDEHGKESGQCVIGEMVITLDSLFDGYRNYPEKTAEVLREGWYFSGDYGFCFQGEYYVVGRKKDIIIVAGNNIYPEDVEDAVAHVPGVVPGRVVAFGEDDAGLGSEMVSVIAETQPGYQGALKDLELKIKEAGMAAGVTIRKVHLVPARWLIKSSSGKPSRKANRDRLAARHGGAK